MSAHATASSAADHDVDEPEPSAGSGAVSGHGAAAGHGQDEAAQHTSAVRGLAGLVRAHMPSAACLVLPEAHHLLSYC